MSGMTTTALDAGRRLIAEGVTIAVAESLTGGLLSAELCRTPGISAVFQGGIVAYRTDLKHSLLGVDAELLARSGAVHPEVAQQMARGVRARLAGSEPCHIGLSTTGVAGPNPQDGLPAGTVFVGVSSRLGDRAVELHLQGLVRINDPMGTREEIRRASVEGAFAALGRELDSLARSRRGDGADELDGLGARGERQALEPRSEPRTGTTHGYN